MGYLVGDQPVGPEGVHVIVLGMLSGCQERDRVTIEGRDTTRLFSVWKRQPEITVVRGRGGGLRTDRGGWISAKFDEIFLLVGRKLCVLPIYDMHHVVADLNAMASGFGAGAMYEIAWQLTKRAIPDGDYTKFEPHFEPLEEGPSEAEISQAKKLTAMVSQLSYANPDIPLRLVVRGPITGGPPAPPAPPPSGPDDYGSSNIDSDIPF